MRTRWRIGAACAVLGLGACGGGGSAAGRGGGGAAGSGAAGGGAGTSAGGASGGGDTGGGGSTDPSLAPDTFSEGTRLEARWIQAPGTPRVLVGWYDAQLHFNCTFSTAYSRVGIPHPDGGDFYCLPQLTSGTGDLFADPACKQLVGGVDCASTLVEIPSTDHTCNGVDKLFAIGDPLNGATIYRSQSGNCVALDPTDPARPASPPHKLGAEMPLSSFVHAHLTIGTGSARIVRRTMTADDGSTQVWGAWDTARGESVYPPDWQISATTLPPGKWQPERIVANDAPAGIYADASCGQPAMAFAACGSLAVKSLFQSVSDSCRDVANYFEAGPALTPAQLFAGAPGSCAPASSSDLGDQDTGYVAVGAPIAASRFADVRNVDLGTGRVRLRAAGTDAGPIGGPYAYFFDTQSGEMCVPGQAADDALRCLPPFSATNDHADDKCTTPLLAWSPGEAACPSVLPSAVDVDEILPAACGETFRRHAFPVGPIYGGPDFTGDSQSCTPVLGAVRAVLLLHPLGAELPASDFVQLSTSDPF